MRLLVTGASGMTGNRLVELLVERWGAGAVVAMTSPRPTPQERGRNNNLARLGVRQIRADLLDPASLSRGLPDVDAVFHLAAELRVNLTDGSEGAPIRSNDTGTENLIRALGSKLKGKLFVYTSSIAVVERADPKGADADEESPCRPRTLYGRTKLRGERIVNEEAERLGFRRVIFRLGTVYGPNCRSRHIFDRFVRWVEAGSWKARVDWPGRISLVYVDDAAEILMAALERPDLESETFFLAAPEEATVGRLARTISELLGKDRDFLRLPPRAVALLNRLLAQDWLWRRTPAAVAANAWRLSLILADGFRCDVSKLRRAFPEKKFVGVREGVARSLLSDGILCAEEELAHHAR